MAWTQITEDDVKGMLSSSELSAINAFAQNSGLSDLLPNLIGGVVDYVRCHIPSVEPGPAGTVPREMRDATLSICRYRLLTRLPVKGLLDENRVREYQDADAFIRRAAEGLVRLEAGAVTPAETARYGSQPKLEL